MNTLIHERVAEARRGFSPQVICRLRSGWAVLGDSQFIAGYSLLLPDPVVSSLNDLSAHDRVQFLLDMTAIGDALLASTDAYRINYEILGNSEPALHATSFRGERLSWIDIGVVRSLTILKLNGSRDRSTRREMIGCSDRFESSWKRVGMPCR